MNLGLPILPSSQLPTLLCSDKPGRKTTSDGSSFNGYSCDPSVLTILGLGRIRFSLVPLSALPEAFRKHWSCCLWSFSLSPLIRGSPRSRSLSSQLDGVAHRCCVSRFLPSDSTQVSRVEEIDNQTSTSQEMRVSPCETKPILLQADPLEILENVL